MSTIKTMSVTNTRDGTHYVLEVTASGEPLCPHCSRPMARCQGNWENCLCGCWWKGANSANYYGQVVFPIQEAGL